MAVAIPKRPKPSCTQNPNDSLLPRIPVHETNLNGKRTSKHGTIPVLRQPFQSTQYTSMIMPFQRRCALPIHNIIQGQLLTDTANLSQSSHTCPGLRFDPSPRRITSRNQSPQSLLHSTISLKSTSTASHHPSTNMPTTLAPPSNPPTPVATLTTTSPDITLLNPTIHQHEDGTVTATGPSPLPQAEVVSEFDQETTALLTDIASGDPNPPATPPPPTDPSSSEDSDDESPPHQRYLPSGSLRGGVTTSRRRSRSPTAHNDHHQRRRRSAFPEIRSPQRRRTNRLAIVHTPTDTFLLPGLEPDYQKVWEVVASHLLPHVQSDPVHRPWHFRRDNGFYDGYQPPTRIHEGLYIGDASQSPLARTLSRNNIPVHLPPNSFTNVKREKKRYHEDFTPAITSYQPRVIDLTFTQGQLRHLFSQHSDLHRRCPDQLRRPAVFEHTVISFLYHHDTHDEPSIRLTRNQPTEFIIVDPLPFEIALMMRLSTLRRDCLEQLRELPDRKMLYPFDLIIHPVYDHPLADIYAPLYR